MPTTWCAATARPRGAVDETALFYLTSRGIPRRTAEELLVLAFLDEAIAEVEDARPGRRAARAAGGLARAPAALSAMAPRGSSTRSARPGATRAAAMAGEVARGPERAAGAGAPARSPAGSSSSRACRTRVREARRARGRRPGERGGRGASLRLGGAGAAARLRPGGGGASGGARLRRAAAASSAARAALFWSGLPRRRWRWRSALVGVAAEALTGRALAWLGWLRLSRRSAFWLWLFAASLAEAEGFAATGAGRGGGGGGLRRDRRPAGARRGAARRGPAVQGAGARCGGSWSSTACCGRARRRGRSSRAGLAGGAARRGRGAGHLRRRWCSATSRCAMSPERDRRVSRGGARQPAARRAGAARDAWR